MITYENNFKHITCGICGKKLGHVSETELSFGTHDCEEEDK